MNVTHATTHPAARIVTTAPPRPADLAVQATGLVKRFGEVTAVDGIDLTVRTGEVFGVLGPNGAGKTTMLRMLTTLLPIDAGQARIFGVDVASQPHQIRQLVGVTGQYASVDENLTAAENLRLFGRLLGLSPRAARATAHDLLGRFGLEDAADRQIRHFSGGMRRRLDLAASLISRPPLIFLDEPTTGLDPRTRGQMWDTIRDLIRDGATVLLTTQYLDEADQLADRIAVIDRGRKVAEGTPEELKTSVGNSTLYVRLTDADRTADAASVAQRILGEAPARELAERPSAIARTPEPGGLSIALPDPNQASDVLIALRSADIGIVTASVRQPTLDEVFLAITGHYADTPDITNPIEETR
jgi:ABC-2 type transport system ATP-binding protein